MEAQSIRLAKRNLPSQPFVLRMADGTTYPVNHPDFITVAPNGRTTVVWDEKEQGFSVLETLLITALEFKPTSSEASATS